MKTREDRRKRRTKAALIDAFNDLVLRHGSQRVRVSDIVERADVGRSTFYEHYANVDDIHMQALARPLASLADAAVGRGDPVVLSKLLKHFWENRERARETFGGQKRKRVVQLLARLVKARLSAGSLALIVPMNLAARQLAESPLALTLGWLRGEGSIKPASLAKVICRTSEPLVAGLQSAEPD